MDIAFWFASPALQYGTGTGTVNLDVNIIADVVCSEVSGEGDGSLLLEGARKGISGALCQTD